MYRLSVFILSLFALNAAARAESTPLPTIGGKDLFLEKLAAAPALLPSEVKSLYTAHNRYRYECEMESMKKLSPELEKIFENYKNPRNSGEVQFAVVPENSGFNVLLARDGQDLQSASRLKCEKIDQYKCSSVTVSQQTEVPFKAEGFLPTATVTEKFNFYMSRNGELVGYYQYAIEATQPDLLSRPTYKKYYSENFRCYFTPLADRASD